MASLITISAVQPVTIEGHGLGGSSLAGTKLTVKPTRKSFSFRPKSFRGRTGSVVGSSDDKSVFFNGSDVSSPYNNPPQAVAKDTSSTNSETKASTDTQTEDYAPIIRVHRTVERLTGTEMVLQSNGIDTKDVVYSPQNALSVRIFLPKITTETQNKKFPILIYFHGGFFCVESPFSPTYHNFLTKLVSESNVIAVSVEYRRAPESSLPIPYNDSWDAIKWVTSHVNGKGPEDWLNHHADFQRTFFSGDSAGGNITHQMGMRFGKEKLEGVNLVGIVLTHPSFWGEHPIPEETTDVQIREWRKSMWRLVHPCMINCDDPWINPVLGPSLAGLGCERILIFVAGADLLRARGWLYYETLLQNGWNKNKVEIVEHEAEQHVFHLSNLNSPHAVDMLQKTVAFIYDDA